MNELNCLMSLDGLSLKGWYTKKNKKVPNPKHFKVLYIIRHFNAFYGQSMEILPGFAAKDGMIKDWAGAQLMPCFITFGNVSLRTNEIIAWKPFPELPKKLKKLVWSRPVCVTVRLK